jgi:Protein of unknown function (DUF3768)
MSAERLRELIDAFRSSFSGGKVMMTPGVLELPDCVKADALVKVAMFTAFTTGNDPYGEHDFGFFELVGRTFYWKIDYYDERCESGSEDPADTEKTTRVLTLMLAAEYQEGTTSPSPTAGALFVSLAIYLMDLVFAALAISVARLAHFRIP